MAASWKLHTVLPDNLKISDSCHASGVPNAVNYAKYTQQDAGSKNSYPEVRAQSEAPVRSCQLVGRRAGAFHPSTGTCSSLHLN